MAKKWTQITEDSCLIVQDSHLQVDPRSFRSEYFVTCKFSILCYFHKIISDKYYSEAAMNNQQTYQQAFKEPLLSVTQNRDDNFLRQNDWFV